MTGILAQIIALTAHGNNYLKNSIVPADFNSSNTTFQFCNRVDFRVFKKKFFFSKPKESIIAATPTEWFQFLKSEGCKHLRLYFEYSQDQTFAKDHRLAGMVGGGGTWLIEAIYDGFSNYWANRWEVTDQDNQDRKIWSVNYGMTAINTYTSNLQIDNKKIKESLSQTLTEIAAFAYNQDLNHWGEQFAKAKSVLESETPQKEYYHTDLIPVENYSLISRQIIFSAGSSWVFGGMGSWNDLGFSNKEDNETYDRLSEQLYSIINQAIIAGTNTF